MEVEGGKYREERKKEDWVGGKKEKVFIGATT